MKENRKIQQSPELNIITENSSDASADQSLDDNSCIGNLHAKDKSDASRSMTSSLNTIVHQPSAFTGTTTNILTVDDVNKEYSGLSFRK